MFLIIFALLTTQLSFAVGSKEHLNKKTKITHQQRMTLLRKKIKNLKKREKTLTTQLKSLKGKKTSDRKRKRKLQEELLRIKDSLSKQKTLLRVEERKKIFQISNIGRAEGDDLDFSYVTNYVSVPDRVYSLNKIGLEFLQKGLEQAYRKQGLLEKGWKPDWVKQIKHVSYLEYMVHFLKSYDKLIHNIKNSRYDRLYVFVGSSQLGTNDYGSAHRYRYSKSNSWVFKMLWMLFQNDKIKVYQVIENARSVKIPDGRNIMILADDASYSGSQMYNLTEAVDSDTKHKIALKIFLPVVFASAQKKLKKLTDSSHGRLKVFSEDMPVSYNDLIPFRTEPGGSLAGPSTVVIPSVDGRLIDGSIVKPQPLVYFDHKLADDLSIPLSNMFGRLRGAEIQPTSRYIPIIKHCRSTDWYKLTHCPQAVYNPWNAKKIILTTDEFIAMTKYIRQNYWGRAIKTSDAESFISWTKKRFPKGKTKLAKVTRYFEQKHKRIAALEKAKKEALRKERRKRMKEDKAREQKLIKESQAFAEVFKDSKPAFFQESKNDEEKRISMEDFAKRELKPLNPYLSNLLKLPLSKQFEKIKQFKSIYKGEVEGADYGTYVEPFTVQYSRYIHVLEVYCPGISRDYKSKCLFNY